MDINQFKAYFISAYGFIVFALYNDEYNDESARQYSLNESYNNIPKQC